MVSDFLCMTADSLQVRITLEHQGVVCVASCERRAVVFELLLERLRKDSGYECQFSDPLLIRALSK